MDIQNIFAEGVNPQTIIEQIKAEKCSLGIPKWDCIKREYYPELHRIKSDPDFWKDKGTKRKPRKVSRVTYGLQKIATRRITQMAFAIPVKRVYASDKDNDTQKNIVDSIEKIYGRVHIDSLNRKRMPMYFASCELLTIWYAIEGDIHSDYGFDTKYKLRCKSYSEMNGYTLYPIFDGYDDLLGMCIEYKSDEHPNGVKTEVYNFEVFTKDRHVHYKGAHDKVNVIPIVDERIKIGKLPLSYIYRQQPIWEDQTGNCDEIELAYSRESEILRHNSAPYLKVSGQMGRGDANKQQPGAKPFSITQGADLTKEKDDTDDAVRIIRTENGGDVSYVTWAQSVEAMKFFISELKENSEEQLQLPNLSMTKMAALGGVGYDARKTVLTDAHLKVGDESGELIMFLEREWKVIVAFLGFMEPKWKSEIAKIGCEHVITPFIQGDEKAEIEKMRLANGGEALISQRTSIARSGLVTDVEKEIEQIKKERTDAMEIDRISNVFAGANT